MEDPSKIRIKLAAVLSVNQGIFWKTELVDKTLTVQGLIEKRLPDMRFYDSENIYALCVRTNTLLDREKTLQSCALEADEAIKIVALQPEEAIKLKPKWRPIHPGCKLIV